MGITIGAFAFVPFANFHAARISSPDNFDRIITKKNQGGAGVDFLIGFKAGGGSEVQSIHFDKSKFTATQARAWLKKHKFKGGVEPAATGESVDYSFDKIYSMLEMALREKYPGPDGYGCQYYVRNVWTDKALLQKGYYGDDETPAISLVTFSVTDGTETTSPSISLTSDPIPVQIQAVPKDGGSAVILDEGIEAQFDEAGKRNAKNDVKTMNSVMRMLMDLMDQEDLEEETVTKLSGKMMAPIAQAEAEETEEAARSAASTNDLPDSSFAYIEPGGKKDASGKTTPRSLRHLPYKGKDGKTIDVAHLRNALARLSQTNISAAAKASVKAKLVAAAKSAGVGDYDKEAIEDTAKTNVVVEAWAALPGETIEETFLVSLQESNIDEEKLIISNVKMLGSKSANGRDYPESTQKDALPLFEGSKAYLNHPMKKDMEEPRRVQDMIGEYKNVHITNGEMYGDLHLLDKPLVHEEVMPVAQKDKSHLVGNSIVARAQMSKQKDGRMLVEKILAARSVDLVAEPATTKGLYESQQITESLNATETEETHMDYKDLTLESLKKERPELLKEHEDSFREKERIAGLEKQVKNLSEQREADAKTHSEQLAEKDKAIAAAEIKEAKRVREILVESVLADLKLPANVKFEEKGGKKIIKSIFRNVIERCATEEEMRMAATEWEKSYGHSTVVSEEKKLNFDPAMPPADGSLHHFLADALLN